jgi:hypothetical protein
MPGEIEVASVTALADLATSTDAENSLNAGADYFVTEFTSALIDEWHFVDNSWYCEPTCVRASDIIEAALHVGGKAHPFVNKGGSWAVRWGMPEEITAASQSCGVGALIRAGSVGALIRPKRLTNLEVRIVLQYRAGEMQRIASPYKFTVVTDKKAGLPQKRFPVGSKDLVESTSGNVPLPSKTSSVSHPPLVAPPAVVAPMPADSVAAQPTAQPPVSTLAFSPPPK